MGIRVQEEKEEQSRDLLERPGEVPPTRQHLSQDLKEVKEGAMWVFEGGHFRQKEQPMQRPTHICVHV